MLLLCTEFGQDLGTNLEDSPFYLAIQKALRTILVVDRDASSLTRSWCGLELHFTKKLGKDLQIYTPAGRIGSSRVKSGPLVEVMEEWDVFSCEASQDADRRQILNYLCDGKDLEAGGIQCHEDGSWVIKDGWKKQLSDLRRMESSRWFNESKEYRYELELKKQHEAAFEQLNQSVRASVVEASNTLVQLASRTREESQVPELTHRGLPLSLFRLFVKQVRKTVSISALEKMSTNDVVNQLKSLGFFKNPELSFMEAHSEKQKPAYIVEHSWNGEFNQTVNSLEWWIDSRELAESTIIWWDVLSRRVASDEPESENLAYASQCLTMTEDAIGKVFLWDSNCDMRLWVMHSLLLAFNNNNTLIDFASSSGCLACIKPYRNGWMHGQFDEKVAGALMKVDAEQCHTTKENDRIYIHNQFKDAIGGFRRFNERLAMLVAGPRLLKAASSNKVEAIRLIASNFPKLRLNSQILSGDLNQTAVHVAAAQGSHETLALLLQLRMDPNAEDFVQDTPLHYAALCGQAESVKILLQHGAIGGTLSVLGNEPLGVANANVAEFLGIRSPPFEQIHSSNGW